MRDTFDMFQNQERGRFGDNEIASETPRGRVNGASDLVDITCALHHETDRAVLVSSDGNETKAEWLPKSRIEIERKNSFLTGRRKSGRPVTLACVIVTAPEYLAKEKGLI